jgi:hypothetical protein
MVSVQCVGKAVQRVGKAQIQSKDDKMDILRDFAAI